MSKKTQDSEILRLIREGRSATSTDNAITAPELAKLMGCGIGKARAIARQLVDERKLKSVQVRRPNVHGVVQPVWAFQVVA